ncbi:proton-coupled folate transporter-like [Watersipora subatra]|uniref:proton-coupled folate transporter-like n=1 Tax=Watersipora subatra TaxID=2589382 RepID=UPI00355B25E0
MGWILDSIKHITVEPIILLFYWSIPYLDHGNGVLLFNYFCRVDFNETFCKYNITSDMYLDGPENHEIQGQVSRWIMYSKFTMVVPMLYSTTILGAISDRFQRKLPMIMPAAGIGVGAFWLMALALIPNINVTSYFLVSSFIFGITGYFGTALMSTSAYLGAHTAAKSRTWRISVFEAALTLGIVAGASTSGLIIDHLGVAALYGITAGLSILAVLYTVIRIVETHTVKYERPLWHEACEFSHVKEYIKTVYKPRAQSRRLYIHIIFSSFVIGTCAGQGLYDVLFLYLTKTRNFTNSLFSLFTGSQALIACIGNIGVMYLLKTRLNLTEPIINAISALGTGIAYSMIAADDNVVIWCSLIFILVSGLGGGACRGFLSKLVPHGEQGQVFAFVAMGQCTTALLASAVFNNLYPVSLGFWPGLAPLLTGVLNFIGVLLALAVYFHRWMHNNTDERMDIDSPEGTSIAMSNCTHSTNDAEESFDEDDIYSKNSTFKDRENEVKSSYGSNIANKRPNKANSITIEDN